LEITQESTTKCFYFFVQTIIGDYMRRKGLAILLSTLLLTTLISGCIEIGTHTKTITITKTESPGTTSSVPTQAPSTTSSKTTTPSDVCTGDSWRDDFSEQTITCALRDTSNRHFNPITSLGLVGDKTQDALTITDFLVNYVYLDNFVENQSMKKGHYYNLKTPNELFQTRTGTYADMAIFGAYALARDGFETYIFYVKTKNGFGAFPGFKITVDHPWVPREPFVIFWPFRIPMRLSAALKLLDLLGETPYTVTAYRVTYENGQYQVENLGTGHASEFKFSITEWLMFGGPDKKTMDNLLSRNFPGCKFTTNLSEVSPNPEDTKSIKVEFPYGILLYSVPFSQRYTEILYTIMVSKQSLVRDLQNCRVLILTQDGDITPQNIPANYTAIYDGIISR